MELLAPAGNPESFHAAIEAGADAVYLGTGEFNARLRAPNFTIPTLSRLIPYAHQHRVKVYVTLNTLIKQQELEPACHLLYQLEQLGVDAIITADLGLADIARRFFPGLRLHASTQVFFHNSPGLTTARELGFSRVVLARELTLAELAALGGMTGRPEIEVFVHGALCYSFSGVCLASSFLGGSSGNRGRCTQVCRRVFSDGTSRASFFSLKDFCALPLLEDLRRAGVAALKIEGRMKNAAYVHTVVSLYRQAIDHPEQAEALAAQADSDLAREKTTYFLAGPSSAAHVSDRPYGGTGIYLGIVTSVEGNWLKLSAATQAPDPGDTLRVHPPSGYAGSVCKVRAIGKEADALAIFVDDAANLSAGAGVYIIEQKSHRLAAPTGRAKLPSAPPVRRSWPLAAKTLHALDAPAQGSNRAPSLFLRFGDLGWLNGLAANACDGIILDLERDALERLTDSESATPWHDRTMLSLPPFIAEGEIDSWRKLIARLGDKGWRRWMCSQVGQRALFDERYTLVADSTIWSLNRFAQDRLRRSGFASFCYSPEDDFPNMRAAASPAGMALLFGRQTLFVSRARPAAAEGSTVVDARDERFLVRQRHGLYYLVGETPLCLTQRREKLQDAGISRFVLDLGWFGPDLKLLENVRECYLTQAKVEPSTMVNFKMGLK
jgi:U32 family peptidase